MRSLKNSIDKFKQKILKETKEYERHIDLNRTELLLSVYKSAKEIDKISEILKLELKDLIKEKEQIYTQIDEYLKVIDEYYQSRFKLEKYIQSNVIDENKHLENKLETYKRQLEDLYRDIYILSSLSKVNPEKAVRALNSFTSEKTLN